MERDNASDSGVATPSVQTPALVTCPTCDGRGGFECTGPGTADSIEICDHCRGTCEVAACRDCGTALTRDEAAHPDVQCDGCWAKSHPTAGVDYVAHMAAAL